MSGEATLFESKMPISEAYRAVQENAGWIDRSHRARLRISGPDRAKFLHNLVTNDVKRLREGSGQEAFVTSPQGKTLAYVTLVATEAAILLRTEAVGLDALLPHLSKYGVFDEVEIQDVTGWTLEYHLAGPRAGAAVEALGLALPPSGDLNCQSSQFQGGDVTIIGESPTGRPGFTLVVPREVGASLQGSFDRTGLVEVDAETFEALRIEAGTPSFGRDVTASNLPQELGRDARTINFVKGCYLGQETVARLDAMGHVNRILKGARVQGSNIVPPSGSAITFEGKTVGSVSSSSFSDGWGSPIFLGYFKVAQAQAGTKVLVLTESGELVAVVLDLPMVPEPG